jgi:hypothetical protein
MLVIVAPRKWLDIINQFGKCRPAKLSDITDVNEIGWDPEWGQRGERFNACLFEWVCADWLVKLAVTRVSAIDRLERN